MRRQQHLIRPWPTSHPRTTWKRKLTRVMCRMIVPIRTIPCNRMIWILLITLIVQKIWRKSMTWSSRSKWMFWTIQMTHCNQMILMQAMPHLDAFLTAYFSADICESLRCSFLQKTQARILLCPLEAKVFVLFEK